MDGGAQLMGIETGHLNKGLHRDALHSPKVPLHAPGPQVLIPGESEA